MWKQHVRARSGESVSSSDLSGRSRSLSEKKECHEDAKNPSSLHLPAEAADLDEYAHVRAPRHKLRQPAGERSSPSSRLAARIPAMRLQWDIAAGTARDVAWRGE